MGYWKGFVFMPHAEPAKMGSPHLHAQNGSETDHFSLELFRFFLEVVVRLGILPDYTDDLLRKVRGPLMDWRRQERGDHRANGASQSPGQRLAHGPECEMVSLVGFRSSQACGFCQKSLPDPNVRYFLVFGSFATLAWAARANGGAGNFFFIPACSAMKSNTMVPSVTGSAA